VALLQVSQRDFSRNEGMCKYIACLKQSHKPIVSGPEMVDPDGSIDESHALERRRGGAFNRASLLPSRANRRALSRSMRAFSASLINEDFLLRPVKAWAFATRSSSRAIVVRIVTSIGMNLASNDA
jgi:hypothetical protein